MDEENCNPPMESGFYSDFEDVILSEQSTSTKNDTIIFDDDSENEDHFEHDLSTINLEEEAHKFIDEPTSSNVFYPNLKIFEKKFFENVPTFKTHLRNTLECQMDQDVFMEVFDSPSSFTTNTFTLNRSQSAELFDTSIDREEEEVRCVSPDLFASSSSSEDEKKCDRGKGQDQSAVEPVPEPKLESSKSKADLIAKIEHFIIELLKDIVSDGTASISVVRRNIWENCEVSNGVLTQKHESELTSEKVSLKNPKSTHRFAMIMHVLAEIYHLLITGTTCTERELYYDDPELAERQSNVNSAIKDVCCILNATPWDLGIRNSSKGLIAGALKIHMSDNSIIDCYMCDRATLIPSDVQAIRLVETTAQFILIVEKDTVFQILLQKNILLNLNSDIILITGKGYPDIGTRLMVKRLWNDFRLPIYALVDADPFGIEIMFVYRYGSKSMAFHSDHLACPQIRWIGIQPSEIETLAIPSAPQTKRDKKRLIELLQRTYISAEIRNELEILQRLDRKAEIEGVASFSANFLVCDYIPNKIKRNLVI